MELRILFLGIQANFYNDIILVEHIPRQYQIHSLFSQYSLNPTPALAFFKQFLKKLLRKSIYKGCSSNSLIFLLLSPSSSCSRPISVIACLCLPQLCVVFGAPLSRLLPFACGWPREAMPFAFEYKKKKLFAKSWKSKNQKNEAQQQPQTDRPRDRHKERQRDRGQTETHKIRLETCVSSRDKSWNNLHWP